MTDRTAAGERSRLIQRLLHQLCVELGFCLPAAAHDAIVADPQLDVDRFVEQVLRAEGLDPASRPDLCAQVRERVAAVLDVVRSLRVTWPDGSMLAEVTVSRDCDPLHTSHVMGSFTRGPGFVRLAPMLDEMKRRWRERDAAAALLRSEELDALGITATDELGRSYEVFNVHFDEQGLLFCVARTERDALASAGDDLSRR